MPRRDHGLAINWDNQQKELFDKHPGKYLTNLQYMNLTKVGFCDPEVSGKSRDKAKK